VSIAHNVHLLYLIARELSVKQVRAHVNEYNLKTPLLRVSVVLSGELQ